MIEKESAKGRVIAIRGLPSVSLFGFHRTRKPHLSMKPFLEICYGENTIANYISKQAIHKGGYRYIAWGRYSSNRYPSSENPYLSKYF